MAVRQRRRTTDATQTITAAVGAVFACGDFHADTFFLPSEKGAQLSMTGEIVATGNGGSFLSDRLIRTLRTFPSLWNVRESDLARYAEKRRFTLLCGDCDRSVAMIGAIAEIVRSGVQKIIIAADTPAERDNLSQSLELMRAGLGDTDITTYRALAYDAAAHYKAYASIYAFLTSDRPEILILGRDSFSRRNNILRRGGDHSLTDMLREAHPVVLTSSATIDSGRTLARNAAVFDPAAVLVFTEEERPLRGCVIYRPEHAVRTRREAADTPEQLGF